MAASFGEQLRAAREARNISLREISEQTCISLRYLEAIESDDYGRLPGGIFNRSFIKAYAKYIGFDEKEALEGYAHTAREKGTLPDEAVATVHQPVVYTEGDSTRSPYLTLLLMLLVLAGLSLVVYAGLNRYRLWMQERAGLQATNVPTQSNQTGAPHTTSPQTATVNNPNAFNIQIKARGEQVWIRTRTDNGKAAEKLLAPDEALQFTPQQSLLIQYAKIKAPALDVTINGRAARVPAEARTTMGEMLIAKDDYEKFLQ
jgi:cytoskeletal protein RodZ